MGEGGYVIDFTVGQSFGEPQPVNRCTMRFLLQYSLCVAMESAAAHRWPTSFFVHPGNPRRKHENG